MKSELVGPCRALAGFNYPGEGGEVRVEAGAEGLMLPAAVYAVLGPAVELMEESNGSAR